MMNEMKTPAVQNPNLRTFTAEELAVLRDQRESETGRSFDDSVALFVSLCLAKVETHYNAGRGEKETKWNVQVWSEDAGKKSRYVRVWKTAELGPSSSSQKFIYAFIDKLTGDVLKPATWKAPAKHARGNVWDADPAASCNYHGPEYLR